jgi:hypothetical protein
LFSLRLCGPLRLGVKLPLRLGVKLSMNNYVFPGLWPFIERLARGRDLHHLGRAREVWHCKQIQDALRQLPRLDPQSQRQLLDHVLKVRASLAIALEGIEAAILEVIDELGLPAPEENHRDPDPISIPRARFSPASEARSRTQDRPDSSK